MWVHTLIYFDPIVSHLISVLCVVVRQAHNSRLTCKFITTEPRELDILRWPPLRELGPNFILQRDRWYVAHSEAHIISETPPLFRSLARMASVQRGNCEFLLGPPTTPLSPKTTRETPFREICPTRSIEGVERDDGVGGEKGHFSLQSPPLLEWVGIITLEEYCNFYSILHCQY